MPAAARIPPRNFSAVLTSSLRSWDEDQLTVLLWWSNPGWMQHSQTVCICSCKSW